MVSTDIRQDYSYVWQLGRLGEGTRRHGQEGTRRQDQRKIFSITVCNSKGIALVIRFFSL